MRFAGNFIDLKQQVPPEGGALDIIDFTLVKSFVEAVHIANQLGSHISIK